MAGRRKRSIDPRQESFLELLECVGAEALPPEPAPPPTQPGKVNHRHKMCMRLSKALAASPFSRDQIAEAVSALTGEKITKTTINNWTSTTHPHEFPGYLYPAFCQALGNTVLLDDTAEAVGRKVVENHVAQAAYYLLLKYHADDQIMHHIQSAPLFKRGTE